MGTWGAGLEQDDTFGDVMQTFEAHLRGGGTVPEATGRVKAAFPPDDRDEAPLVRLALAMAQWTYGALDPALLEEVRRDVLGEAGLERWREAGVTELRRRKALLRRTLEKLSATNPRPKRPARPRSRAPLFAAGDCLAVKLADGRYAAALVLAADASNPEYGRNLIGVLDYLDTAPPAPDVFARRRWLRLTHHKFDGRLDVAWYLPVRFRPEAARFTEVGRVPILRSDPTDSPRYCGWDLLGQQAVYQKAWENGAP